MRMQNLLLVKQAIKVCWLYNNMYDIILHSTVFFSIIVVIAGVAPDLVVATAKSHLTTATLSRTQNEQLYQRRCIDSQDMVYKFQELFTATKKSLRDTKVSVTELVGHLECLGSIKPTFKDAGLLPLRRQLPGLANAETIDAVMSVVKDYCSFFNYHMLEHIINEFGTKQDKRNLASYIEDFTKYAERCITQCPSEVGKMNEEGYANLLVTLDDSFDNCAVSHLNVFIGNLRKILNIPSNVDLRLCHINLGSIKLIFQIPLFVQQAIFPLSSDQEAELSSLAGVVQLSCGDYQFTRHQTKVNSSGLMGESGLISNGYLSRKGGRSQHLIVAQSQARLIEKKVWLARIHVSCMEAQYSSYGH